MKRLLHVQPHSGGGVETYLDLLLRLEGYEQRREPLSGSRSLLRAGLSIPARWPRVARLARAHDLLNTHGDMASILALPLLRARPSVATTHGLHFLRRARGPRRPLADRLMRAVVRSATRTVCTSPSEYEELSRLAGPAGAERLVLVTNGIDPPRLAEPAERAAARAELGLPADAVVCLYLGQLEPRKDPLTAVRAVRTARAHVPTLLLLVAGDGPLRTEIEAEADPGVRVLGFRGDARPLLAAADLFVMPSVREGLSMAVLEAMGHGVAAVVSNGPGNPDAVGAAGVVCPVGDVSAFATSLARLARDPEERRRLGDAGRERITAEFSQERTLAGMRAVYEEALAAAGA